MLHPEPDGERLPRHPDALREEPPHRVARRVARRQQDDRGSHLLAPGQANPAHLPLRHRQLLDPRAEPDGGAQGVELRAHPPAEAPEPVGPHVRLRVLDEPRDPRELRERRHDVVHEGVPDPGGELPVRKRSRAPLPELGVALGVKGPVAPEPGDVPGPLLHRPAAFQHDGGGAEPRQREGGEQPGRPGPHDDGRKIRPTHRGVRERVGGRFVPLRAGDPGARRLLHRGGAEGALHRVDAAHVAFPAGVVPPPDHGKSLHLVDRNAYNHRYARGQRPFRQRRIDTDVEDADRQAVDPPAVVRAHCAFPSPRAAPS